MKKKCLYCKKKFEPSKLVVKRQKYCSSTCREKHWRELNKEYIKQSKKEYWLKIKQPAICKCCGKIIKEELRTNGLLYCSDKCRSDIRHKNSKERRERIQQEFTLFKEDIGCQQCGYNKCGACLDFHHDDPKTKITRIYAGLWYYQKKIFQKEFKKCTLLCKNCHYEVHEKNKNKNNIGGL